MNTGIYHHNEVQKYCNAEDTFITKFSDSGTFVRGITNWSSDLLLEPALPLSFSHFFTYMQVKLLGFIATYTI